MDVAMDVFSDTCAMTSPITSSVVTTSDPSMTEIGFEGGQDDFAIPFLDPSSIKKEGYEEKQPPFYDGSSDSYLPPYPSNLKTENGNGTGGLVSPPPSVVSSGMTAVTQAILQHQQHQHSNYHRSLNIVYEQKNNLSPESSSPSVRQVGRHKNNGSDRQFTAADSNSGTPPPKSFVPCKVCGDKASGYHYGVTSCEGCKGFFRRSIQKQIEYRCLRDGKCMVIRLNRNRCQFCRFKKCLAVGMSKDSVRYGRVPKRSRERNEDTRVTQSEADQSNQIPENKENKEVAMYDLVLSISQAHHTNCAYTEEKTRGLVRKPAIFMNDFQSNSSDGQTVDSLEQQKIVMWQQFASFLTPSIQRIVEFAKHVPGFLDLTQDDQLILIKLGFFEIWLIHVARMVDTLDSTLTFCDGSYVSRQQMEFMFDHEFVSIIFSFIASLNSLQLSDTEIGLYSAIVLFTSERSGIYDHKAIEQQREKFMEALKFQLNRNHPSAPHLFATLVMKLPELHSIGEKHMDHLRWFRANWIHLKLPPLFAELFDIPRSEQDLAQR